MQSRTIQELIQRFGILPGVGTKTAQRMAMYLLERDRDGALALAKALEEAATVIKNCARCRNLTEKPVCDLCESQRQDASTLCIVETPSDVLAIEQSGVYGGYYFVLMGRLSPLDGIGPAELGIDALITRLDDNVSEVILATNPTVEGEATATYLSERLAPLAVRVSRLAHGVPVGGELEYVDGGTLAHALNNRRQV